MQRLRRHDDVGVDENQHVAAARGRRLVSRRRRSAGTGNSNDACPMAPRDAIRFLGCAIGSDEDLCARRHGRERRKTTAELMQIPVERDDD
jgi:hypothetical protein